jgi:hypothetical protein
MQTNDRPTDENMYAFINKQQANCMGLSDVIDN